MTSQRHDSRWTLVLRMICIFLFVFTFVMAATPELPRLPGGLADKSLHAITFTVLSPLAAIAWPKVRLLGLAVLLSGFGGLIEGVQAIPALHRDAELLDWLADVAAIGLGLAIVLLVRMNGARSQ